ncbi:hypothetical protein MLD38_001442 [Melastoma candidum]|uniref:Uncharacterized protein n=1 Tax=Melastoma candidum TaxID=119954 RepID=A0ACB9SDC1_9MYRT|nr:hypothetical protein MLD38_001442 [Melastoma candidum]
MELRPGSGGEEGGGEFDDDAGKRHFHILAVDDSLVDRKLLERLLGSVSLYQVTSVGSGNEALQYLGLVDNCKDKHHDNEGDRESCSSSPSSTHEGEKKVNLIMTDYSMPGINGYDLLRRVKVSNWKDVPVVVMSSENIPSRIRMCIEGGAQDFLLKPLKIWDLERIPPYSSSLLTHHHLPSSLKRLQLLPMTNNNAFANTKDEDII